jgi:midasin (ATPase involved in ribosome maturation)
MGIRSENREKFISAICSLGSSTVTKTQINEICENLGISNPHWFTNDDSNRLSRGVYKVPFADVVAVDTSQVVNMQAQVIPMTKIVKSENKIQNVSTDLEETNLIPEVYRNYVPFGNFDDILSIVKSMRFFPVFISGHSGNGKTMSVEQACARTKRKFVCVSMTPETDESDLLGNYVLINGNMEWRDGPVTTAARQGAVLCIDEIDYGAQNLSCLQRVLEGKPFMLKKKGEIVTPASGFTVFATANTKGKGSDDGRYMFTNVLNEAFLERFRNTLEQEWPPATVERKIIRKELSSVGREDDNFADKLVTWSNVIRKTFDEGGCDEVISTRRLVHIVETYGIFGDKMKALSMSLNRFDADTKASFLDLYTKVDADSSVSNPEPAVESEPQQEWEDIQY